MDRRLRHASGSASVLNSSAPRMPPTAPLTRSYSSNAKLYGNAGPSASDLPTGTEASRQMERYCETLEADHAELRHAFNEQSNAVTSLTSLVKEREFRDTAVRALESKVSQYEAFLHELQHLVSDGRGLRMRSNPNKRDCGVAGKTAAAATAPQTTAPSVDAIRALVQQSQLRLRELTERDTQQTAALKQLRAERDARAAEATRAATTKPDTPTTLMHTPASAKEMVNMRQKVLTLEQRLFHAEKDARSLTTQLQRKDDALKAATSTAESRAEEVATLKANLTLQEKLLEDVRERCLTAERRLASITCGGAVPAANSEVDTTSNSKGARLTTSSLSHVLIGAGYARALQRMPLEVVEAALKDAFSRALHVPVVYLTKFEVLASKDGVVVNTTVRHATSNSHSGDPVNAETLHQVLLSHPFLIELAPLTEAAAAAVESELATVRASLETRVREGASLQRQVSELQATVERLHRERSAQDAEVNSAIDVTAATVRDLHAALKVLQQENAGLRAAREADEVSHADIKAQLKTQQTALQATQKAVTEAEMKVKQLTADKATLEQKISTLIATHAEETAAMEHAQQARDASRSEETNGRLQALETALQAAKDEARRLQSDVAASERRRRDIEAERDEHAQRLTKAAADIAEVEKLLSTVLTRNGTALGAQKTLIDKVRAMTDVLARKEKAVQEAKADLQREKNAAVQAQADALAALTQSSSQFVATVQKELADTKAQLRAQEQRADMAERRLASEVATLKDAAKSAEGVLRASAASQCNDAEEKLGQLQRQLASAQDAARDTQGALEMKIIALEGLLEAEREQREEEKKKQEAAVSANAAAAATASSRDLQREVRVLKREKEHLTQQVSELETDLADFARMREELQTSLDMAEKQLRAKKHDFDLVVKQLLRLEDQERALKEENESLRGSLVGSPRAHADAARAGDAAPAEPAAATTGMVSHSSGGLNAPSRLTPRRSLKPPKSTTGKYSPASPPAASDRTSSVVATHTRVLKRHASATAFSRTASAAAMPAPRADAAAATVAAPKGAPIKSVKAQPFQRSHTATSQKPSASSSVSKCAAPGKDATFEAPPRLNDFQRQGSSRAHYTSVQPPQQNLAVGRTSVEEERPASTSRRRPSSPLASTVTNRPARESSSSGILKWQPSATDSASAAGAFIRTPSSFLAAAAGNSASFVRTPSGYRRVQQ